MTSKIMQRLLREPGIKESLGLLGEGLNSSDYQSVMLEIARLRSLKVKPSGIMREFGNNRFLKPSVIPQDVFNMVDRLAYDCLPGTYYPVELSPVAPFGSCSSVSKLSQNLVVSTVRHSEIVADPTNLLAIEASYRRKSILEEDPRSNRVVKLCSSHRLTRGQSFGGGNGKFTAHFRVFSLLSAGRDAGDSSFELDAIEEHIRFYLELCKRLDILKDAEVSISDFSGSFDPDRFEPVFNRLAEAYSSVRFLHDNERKEARNYYSPLAFRIRFFDDDEKAWDLVDGGMTGWTQIYLNNRKERMLGSAIGTELMLKVFPKLLSFKE
jgi:hypothetical protein